MTSPTIEKFFLHSKAVIFVLKLKNLSLKVENLLAFFSFLFFSAPLFVQIMILFPLKFEKNKLGKYAREQLQQDIGVPFKH